MFKNNLKVTLMVLKRKKLFSAITILGITIPLMFLMIVISTISHIASHESPQSNFDKVLLFDYMKCSIKREHSISGNLSGNPTYDFVKKYVKAMKTPEEVGVIANFNLFNLYQNNQKTKLNIAYTDGEFWNITDFKFISGKAYNTNDVDNMQPLAVIDEFTKELVFGDENAVGKTLKIFHSDYKVVGVVKNSGRLRVRTYANVYLPITTSQKYTVKDIFGAGVSCFIKSGSRDQFPQIESEFNHIIEKFKLSNYKGLTKVEAELRDESFNRYFQSLFRGLFSIQIKKESTIYLAYIIIFFFFILLPSINLLYIHISRINERSSEIGVRKSFGGNRGILSRQFIFENITITIISGMLALIFTTLFCKVVNASNVIPGLHLKLNSTSLGIIIILWLVFGIITGILPALRMSRMKIIDALHQHDSHQFFDFVVWKAKRLKMLLVVEFIITFMGLALVGLFFYKYQKNSDSPLGFNVEDAYCVSVNKYDLGFQGFGRRRDKEAIAIYNQIETSNLVNFYGKWNGNEPYTDGLSTYAGDGQVGGIKYPDINITETGENMHKIFDLDIIAGRWFNKSDKRPDYYPVLITRNFKEKLFGDDIAVGKTISIQENELEIIGVVDHYKFMGEFSKPGYVLFYCNIPKRLRYSGSVGSEGDYFKVKPGVTLEQVNELATRLSKQYPDYEIEITPLKTDRSKYFMKIWGPLIAVITVFAFVMLIVLLGLFGVLWYNVSLRKTEIGLRRAVGANQNKIFKQVITEMLSWASVGILIGIILVAQIPVLKLLPVDLDVFIFSVLSSALIIYLLIILCSLIPGVQATKIQPAIALHQE